MNGVLRGIARTLFILIVVAAVGIGSFIGISLVYFSRELPNHKQLAEYVPAIGTKVYAGEGAFMTEFASEHRMVVPISQVPKAMIQAVLDNQPGPAHNIVAMNAGAAIYVAGLAPSLKAGIERASQAIKSGAAKHKME